MPCYATLSRRARRLGITVPLMSDEDVRKMLGASDHNEVHFILDNMDDERLRELLARRDKKGQVVMMEAIA